MLKLNNINKYYNAGTVNEMCRNGSGKTTMLNIICGSIPGDSGSIQIGSEDITHLAEYKRQRRIGRVYQNPAMGTCPHMTILEFWTSTRQPWIPRRQKPSWS